VIVCSKFDNRLKEFAERWEVDRYLSAAGYLSADARPFFVALPKVPRATRCSRRCHCTRMPIVKHGMAYLTWLLYNL